MHRAEVATARFEHVKGEVLGRHVLRLGRGCFRNRTRLALAFFVLVGVVLRLRGLLAARSLWLDEVSLALNIRERGMVDLLSEPLRFGQSAPPGFLALSRFAADAFGTGLVAIRIVPFVAGVLTVVLAALLARRVFVRPAAQVAFVASISLSPTLIFYASEMKQYSSDALAIMLALYLANWIRESRANIVPAILGFLAVFSSLPGLLVFGLLGLMMIAEAHHREGLRGIVQEARAKLSILAAWSLGALMHIVHQLTAGSDRTRMQAWWGDRGGFAPEGVSGLSELSWYVERAVELLWLTFKNSRMTGPDDRSLEPLVLFAAVGLVALAFRGPHRSPQAAQFLGVTAVAALLLAELRFYPLSSRLAIYLIPVVLGLLGFGLDSGLQRSSVTSRWFAALSAFVLATSQFPVALNQFGAPYVGRDMHSALLLVDGELGEGDAVVTNALGERIVDWHRVGTDFTDPVTVIDPSSIEDDSESQLFAEGRPSRVWIVATHRIGEAEEISAALSGRYRYVTEFNQDGTYIALVSDRGPIAFAPTGDRRLATLLSAEQR